MVLEYQFAIAAALFLAPLGLNSAPTVLPPSSNLPLLAHRAYALIILGLMLAAPFVGQYSDRATLHLERTFFGVHRVVKNIDNIHPANTDSFRTLYHGTTIHGVEARYLLPNIRPATYYHPTGPIGQILTEDALGTRLNSIAVIGLGAGSLALYNEPNCVMRFYEIDPAVIAIARDPALFDYLNPKYTRGTIELALGDGRLAIAQAPDHSFGIIIVDAFSSDSIPTHLLTREAIEIYRRKLRADGLIAIHISNSFFDLKPIVARLAADAGLTARARLDIATNAELLKEAKSTSLWTVLSAHDTDLGPIAADPRWTVLHPSPSDPLWTDDYSNVLKVLNWGK